MKENYKLTNDPWDTRHQSTELLLLNAFIKARKYWVSSDFVEIQGDKRKCPQCGYVSDLMFDERKKNHEYDCELEEAEKRVKSLQKELCDEFKKINK